MQQARSHSFSNAWRWLVVLTALLVAPAVAPAQHMSGALGVTLTVLPPVGTQAVELVAFSVGRDGVARLETTAPVASPVSLIIMTTVASSVNGFLPIAQAPVLIEGTCRRDSRRAPPAAKRTCAPRLSYRLELGRLPLDSGSREAKVRISYLVVPGT